MVLEVAAMAEDSTIWPMAGSRRQAVSAPEETYEMYSGLTDLNIEHLHILGLCLSSISFLASVTSLYWLVRMRRSFRHE